MSAPDERTASPEAVGLARVEALLGYLREDVKGLRSQLAENYAAMVTRNEWVMRNQAVEQRFQDQGREIAQLRTEVKARHHPWPQVATAVVAVGSLAITLLRASAGG